MINVFQPNLGKEELLAVEKVFASNWIGKGAKTKLFEEKFLEHLRENSINGGGIVLASILAPKVFSKS
ncbi:MAG: hypothetical protein IKN16_03465 [Selenomonadaceae bacterium]|nr:hypothetical protein [Selenomonadaceae bacterium]MBR6887485.1 hypothetical protein [Selenomonadaceae bacterium]